MCAESKVPAKRPESTEQGVAAEARRGERQEIQNLLGHFEDFIFDCDCDGDVALENFDQRRDRM